MVKYRSTKLRKDFFINYWIRKFFHMNKTSQNEKEKEVHGSQCEIIPTCTAVHEHFYTFQQQIDLFTLLYSTIIFKWIQTDRILIVVDNSKIGYKVELFLRNFRINSIFLDNEMPVNTNRHFYSQFLKGMYGICISSSKFSSNSPSFAEEIVNNSPIPISIIKFDIIDKQLLGYTSFHPNTRAIYHMISYQLKDKFFEDYADVDSRISFSEYKFDEEQVAHLRYRCEDIFHGIRKSDIKRAKVRKINLELLHSKQMEDFFTKHPQEKQKIINSIEENNVKALKPSTGFLPSYLVHENKNEIAQAIRQEYSSNNRKQGRRRKGKGKMEKYFECLDKNDGSHALVNF